jgi:hypothetical protein
MKYRYDYVIIILLVIAIIIFNSYTKTRTGFQNNMWSNEMWPKDLIRRFVIYQKTVNENKNRYDLRILQQQASPEEAEEYLKNGYWYWPDDLKIEYMHKVWANPMIKIYPPFALQHAMKIYNQNAARELLAWNTKEGHFLLYGADLGVTEGMPDNVHNTIKCSIDEAGNSRMEKKVYDGMNLWNGYMNTKTTIVKPEDIPNEVAGFQFVKNACEPCVALNYPGDYSCPFELNVKGNNKISNVWKQLWGL